MTGRALNQPKKKTPTIVAPKTSSEWDRLMKIVISTAEAQNHRSLHGLRKALVDGKSERTLRMMGIIHMGDLPRVFPPGDVQVSAPQERRGSKVVSHPQKNLTPKRR